jgi:Chaperone of endosialidase
VHCQYSPEEVSELMNAAEQYYLYCGKERSKLFELVDQISQLDKDKNSPAALLRSHINAGYTIATADSILDVLEYVEEKLDELYKHMDQDQAKKLYGYFYSIIENINDGALDVDQDSLPEEQKRATCCDPFIIAGQPIKVREKLYVLKSAKFFDNVEFKSTVEFQDGITITGSLSSTDVVASTVDALCNLTVGCNIAIPASSDALHGNIIQNGVTLLNTFGTNNIFVGTNSGNFTMSGVGGNTAIGTNTLAANTGGQTSVAIGTNALAANTTGLSNVAIGFDSMLVNTTGLRNIALGANTLIANTSGQFNTALGDSALASNISGNGNTSVGLDSLFLMASGNDNVALGFRAGDALTAGSNNVYIANPGIATESGIIRIGTSGTQTSAYVQGIFGSTIAVGGLAVEVDSTGLLGTVVSSADAKTDIEDLDIPLEQLNQLRPVKFAYRNDASHALQYGLIAHEVAEVFPELVVYDNDNKPYSVRYQVLPVLLLHALKKQGATIDDLMARVVRLEKA